MNTSNRKLKRNVVFENLKCYNFYQIIIIMRFMSHYNLSELNATDYYVKSGLAKLFADHHRPHNNNNEIIVSKIGQSIL